MIAVAVEAPGRGVVRLFLDECPLGPWGRPVRRAVEQLHKAHEQLAGVRRDVATRQSAIAGLEDLTGPAVLEDAGAADRIGADVTAGRAAIQALERAARTAEERIAAAEPGVLVAQRTELAQRLEAAQNVARKHARRTEEILTVLREHQGADYVPAPVRSEIDGRPGGSVGTLGGGLLDEADAAAVQLWVVDETIRSSQVPQWTRSTYSGVHEQIVLALPATVKGPHALRPPAHWYFDQVAFFRLDALRLAE